MVHNEFEKHMILEIIFDSSEIPQSVLLGRFVEFRKSNGISLSTAAKSPESTAFFVRGHPFDPLLWDGASERFCRQLHASMTAAVAWRLPCGPRGAVPKIGQAAVAEKKLNLQVTAQHKPCFSYAF